MKITKDGSDMIELASISDKSGGCVEDRLKAHKVTGGKASKDHITVVKATMNETGDQCFESRDRKRTFDGADLPERTEAGGNDMVKVRTQRHTVVDVNAEVFSG